MRGRAFLPNFLIISALTAFMMVFNNCGTDVAFSPDTIPDVYKDLPQDPTLDGNGGPGSAPEVSAEPPVSEVPMAPGEEPLPEPVVGAPPSEPETPAPPVEEPPPATEPPVVVEPPPGSEPPPSTEPPPTEPPVAGSPPPVICNPLSPTDDACGPQTGAPPPGSNGFLPGLSGSLFYLSPTLHLSLFSGNLRNAKLDDYAEFGVRVPQEVILTEINISPRSWESGFEMSNGQFVTNDQNQKLVEWFSIRVGGYLRLPAGSYQFAMVSDDGMRVVLDNVPILNHDGIHAPVLDCSPVSVAFDGQQVKPLQVAYFQGPRVQIAMQLLYRKTPANPSSKCEMRDWQPLPADSFFH
ncbi:MAG: hypothetical protein IT288_02895 [Bdellovibrionales bacterium]|nr:hypothetical protein [Bdellovibrionales bacterium]